MKKLSNFPHVVDLINFISIDNAMDQVPNPIIPDEYLEDITALEEALFPMEKSDIETIAMGEESDADDTYENFGVGHDIINIVYEIFDGDLTYIFFEE